MNKQENCPFCNSKDLKFNFIESNHELLTCLSCELHFISPYKQNDNNRNPLSSYRQFLTEKQAVKYYLPFIINYIKDKESLLDVGCGCGVLLNESKALGVKKIIGVENDKKRAEFARENTDCLIVEDEINNFNSLDKFQTVTLINVFSHIPDLNTFFIKINNLLEDKGHLVIKTGLMENGFGKKNWYDWQIPEHIQFLGSNTPEFIANKFNFKLREKILIPLSEDLISKEYLNSPGRYSIVNFLKSFLSIFPLGVKALKNLYNWSTKNKLYTAILIFEKA
jgi:SAM-dependent methyltransferase